MTNMNNPYEYLVSIANTIKDYRLGEIPEPTPEHINKWINQFDMTVHLPLLQEIDYVLKKTYLSKSYIKRFLYQLITSRECSFWGDIKILNIQKGGNSQKEMLSVFNEILNEKYRLNISDCGNNPSTFLYLDDVIFSGNRIRSDISNWIKSESQTQITVYIVTFANHRGGQYYASTEIEKFAKANQKDVKFVWWTSMEIEDRKSFITTSDVLRPISLPDDDCVKDYVANMKHSLDLRRFDSRGNQEFFMSNQGRSLLEQEMLKAGVKIRKSCPYFKEQHRPLGYSRLDTLGFGSMIVTFRNCPNNAPLALWAGNPWYPLFPRKIN